jgi:type VII secretion-associated protein (TIGR03931 family)
VSGTPVRVAVQLGAATARLAAVGHDGEPWLAAEATAAGTTVPSLLAELVPCPEELVLVHPAGRSASRAPAWMGEGLGLAGHVRAVSAPLAAAGRGDVVVLDVGHAGAEVTRLDTHGQVLALQARPVGGAALDALLVELLGLSMAAPAALAEARRVREALSLLPSVEVRTPECLRVGASEVRAVLARPLGAVIEALREVLRRTGPAPVLLVGGLARMPLLAELVDEAGIADVSVAPRPDASAVLGALTLPATAGLTIGPRGFAAPRPGAAGSPRSSGAGSERCPRAAPATPVRPGPDRPRPIGPSVAGPELTTGGDRRQVPARRLPPLPPRTRRPLLRTALLAAAAVGLIAGLLGVGALLPSGPAAATVPAGVLVQYGYRLDIPSGWEHTGGLPERRRILLTRAGAPEGSDLIAVERTPLGYDTGAEPERAQAELRAEFDAAAGGSALSGYRDARIAGREATSYRQQEADARTVVDWFVLLDGDAQLSVGCRYTATGNETVLAACAVVIASLRRA